MQQAPGIVNNTAKLLLKCQLYGIEQLLYLEKQPNKQRQTIAILGKIAEQTNKQKMSLVFTRHNLTSIASQ